MPASFALSAGPTAPALSTPAPQDAKIKELTRRIEVLENGQAEYVTNEDRKAQVNSFLHNRLTLGGFFEGAFTVLTGPDTKTQAVNSSDALGLNLSAEFLPSLRFASQAVFFLGPNLSNPHHHPNATTLSLPMGRMYTSYIYGALIPQGYLEFDLSESHHIQGGLGYVPFGTSFQQREPVLFLRRSGPEMGRTTNLVTPVWSGVHLYGRFHSAASSWGYNLYTFSPIEKPQLPGVGARVWWATAAERLTLGISSQFGKRDQDTFKTWGLDMKLKSHPFVVTSEFARQTSAAGDPWSVYFEPSVAVYEEDWLVYAFIDYADSAQNRVGSLSAGFADPYELLAYGAGVNWLPTSFTRIRLGLAMQNYIGSTAVIAGQNRDFMVYDLSAGVAF
ncbi:MAG: hypothetical protein AB7F66_00180 [Bacteriovoracia bacterium]